MEKGTKITYLIVIFTLISILTHNILSIFFGKREVVFLIATFILLFTILPASLAANLITFVWKGKPKDIWKIGFLGVFGLLGAITGKDSLYALYVFFVFFGLKGLAKVNKK